MLGFPFLATASARLGEVSRVAGSSLLVLASTARRPGGLERNRAVPCSQPRSRTIAVARFRIQEVHEERRQRLRRRCQRGVRQNLELRELPGDEILRPRSRLMPPRRRPEIVGLRGTEAGL